MRIGIDFDNTIVCYDRTFYTAALEKGLVPGGIAQDKTAIRDHLRRNGMEQEWILLQGHVYGDRMDAAAPYPGFDAFLHKALDSGHELCIVSHKTRYPKLGPQHDLHEAARSFLERRAICGSDGKGLSSGQVYFEETRAKKIDRIAMESCDAFIDDLPDVLCHPDFPADVCGYLFDPHGRHEGMSECRRLISWAQALEFVLAT